MRCITPMGGNAGTGDRIGPDARDVPAPARAGPAGRPGAGDRGIVVIRRRRMSGCPVVSGAGSNIPTVQEIPWSVWYVAFAEPCAV